MVLEGFLYRDAPDGLELRELLVRALVTCDDDEDTWGGPADGLLTAYAAWLTATADEEAELMGSEPSDHTADRSALLHTEAETLFRSTWTKRYARHAKSNGHPDPTDAANCAYWCDGALNVIYNSKTPVPKGVIRDVALALSDQSFASTQAATEAFARLRRDSDAN